MKSLKEQANDALKLDPCAITFISDKKCVKECCGSFKRYTENRQRCASCQSVKNKTQYNANKEKSKAYNRAWYLANKEYCQARNRARYLVKKEKANARLQG